MIELIAKVRLAVGSLIVKKFHADVLIKESLTKGVIQPSATQGGVLKSVGCSCWMQLLGVTVGYNCRV